MLPYSKENKLKHHFKDTFNLFLAAVTRGLAV